MKKTIWIVLVCVVVLLIGFVLGTQVDDKEPELTPEELLDRFEDALGDEYKKQTVSEVIAQLTYAHKDGSNPIYYYFVKTTYYKADPAEVTGLNTDAFRTVFDPDRAENAEEMMIQDWCGCLYTLPEKSYLCWTAAPNISYVIEYDPLAVSDADIIRMAEKAAPVEPTE